MRRLPCLEAPARLDSEPAAHFLSLVGILLASRAGRWFTTAFVAPRFQGKCCVEQEAGGSRVHGPSGQEEILPFYTAQANPPSRAWAADGPASRTFPVDNLDTNFPSGAGKMTGCACAQGRRAPDRG